MSVALAKVESWEDHVEAWQHIRREVDGSAWALAAIAASVKIHWGERSIEKFAEEVGFGRSSVFRLVKAHETFDEKSRRRDFLKFKHYEEALAADDPLAALDLAESNKWSANKLRAHLKAPEQVTAPAACSTVSGSCGPLTVDDKIFHISALIENFYAVKDYELGPLVRVGTKSSLRRLAKQAKEVIRWLEALNESIKERTR